MGRTWRAALVAAVIFIITAAPALAADGDGPAIDIDDFLPNDLGDVTDDGVPDQFDDKDGDGLPDIPEGRHGIWDDLVGAKTPEEFLEEVDFARATVDFDNASSSLMGPCGGLAISYDSAGNSIDAAVDRGDDDPPVDVLTGDQAFTESNPFRVDASGVVAYFGFTPDVQTLSLRGFVLPPEEYAPDALAFHDHRWEVVIVEVSADDGGDPNEGDDNRNAALVELNDILPFPFRAKLKARGGIIDLWGPEDLPSLTADNIEEIANGREYCFGEGWVEFIGDEFPLFTIPGALALAIAATGFSGVVFNARPVKSWRA